MREVIKVGPVQTKKTPTIASVRRAGLSVTDMTLRFFLVASRPELLLRYIFDILDILHSLRLSPFIEAVIYRVRLLKLPI